MGNDQSSTVNTSATLRRRLILVVTGLFGISVAATVYFWPRSHPRVVPVVPVQPDNREGQPIDPNPGFVGMQTCASCHSRRVNEFLTTKHFQACREPEPGKIAPGFENGKGTYTSPEHQVRFEMSQSGRDFFQSNTRMTPSGEQRFDAKIGLVYGSSRTADEVYFTWHGDRLYELPVTWLYPQERWANSPFSPFGNADLSRTTTTRCLECHNTWIEHLPGTENQYRRNHMLIGVQCEKCHGPGASHVEFHKANPQANAPHAVVRPAQLERERQMDLCAQCHSNANKSRGPAFQYRAGEPLDRYFRTSIIKYPEKDHVIDQNKYLRQSKCFQQSEMTCITCHDPHRPKEAGLGNRSCMKCHHDGGDCKEQPKLPAAVRGECFNCHMPQYNRIQVYFHNESESFIAPVRPKSHRIAISPTATKEVLLAWNRTQSDEEHRRAADRLQAELVNHWLDEAKLMHGQYRYMAEISALREVIRLDPSPAYKKQFAQLAQFEKDLEAKEYVALNQRDQRRFTEAIATFEEILAIKPDWARIHVQIGALYAEIGKRDLAIQHWNQVEQYDPDDANGHLMLGVLAMTEHRPDDALASLRKADVIEPYNASIQYRIGMAYIAKKSWSEAIAALERAVTIDPNHVAAHRELIRSMREGGKKQEAVATAQRVVRRIQPENVELLKCLAEAFADVGQFENARGTAAHAADVAQKTDPDTATQLRRLAEEYRLRARTGS